VRTHYSQSPGDHLSRAAGVEEIQAALDEVADPDTTISKSRRR
jgi:hypothetical protein